MSREDAAVAAGIALMCGGLFFVYWPLIPILVGVALIGLGLWRAV